MDYSGPSGYDQQAYQQNLSNISGGISGSTGSQYWNPGSYEKAVDWLVSNTNTNAISPQQIGEDLYKAYSAVGPAPAQKYYGGYTTAAATPSANAVNVNPAIAQTGGTTPDASAGGGGGGGVGGVGGTGGNLTDPYAAARQALLFANTRAGAATQLGQLPGQAATAAQDQGVNYGNSISQLIDSLRLGQQGVDQQGQQNELSRIIGNRGVLNMVHNGLSSGGTIIGNKNAGDSSAVEALARAYSVLGRQGMADVGGKYALGQNAVDMAQNNFNKAKNQKITDTNVAKTNIINSIVADAQQQLNGIDQQFAMNGLPDRLGGQADAMKEQVRQIALEKLQQYDSLLAQGVGGINPVSQEQNRIKAGQLANAGVPPENAFQLTPNPSPQFQNTGQFPSNLPLFTFK